MTSRPVSTTIGMLGSLMAFLLAFSSCLNNNADCVSSGNCDTTEPTTAQLTVEITINAENPAVPIAVYYGDVSDSSLYFLDTLTSSVTYTVSLDQKFSGTAKYRQGQRTIVAIDGDRTKLKTSNDCGDTCYKVKDATLALKLIK